MELAGWPRRLQGVFVSDQEVEQLVQFWTQDRFQNVEREVFDSLLDEAKDAIVEAEGEADPMLSRAIELAREHRTISTSMLQRRLRIGYPRAARVMDDLEERGIVGPAEGQGSREVLIDDNTSEDEAPADEAAQKQLQV